MRRPQDFGIAEMNVNLPGSRLKDYVRARGRVAEAESNFTTVPRRKLASYYRNEAAEHRADSVCWACASELDIRRSQAP